MKSASNIVLKILGVLLIVAAVLKGHELLTVPVAGRSIWTSRGFLIVQIELELALGLWIVSGIAKRAVWWVVVGCFILFGGISLYKGLTGADSCGCFGRVPVNPWVTLLAIDFPALVVLLLYRQGRKSPLERISPKLGQSWVINPIMIVLYAS